MAIEFETNNLQVAHFKIHTLIKLYNLETYIFSKSHLASTASEANILIK